MTTPTTCHYDRDLATRIHTSHHTSHNTSSHYHHRNHHQVMTV